MATVLWGKGFLCISVQSKRKTWFQFPFLKKTESILGTVPVRTFPALSRVLHYLRGKFLHRRFCTSGTRIWGRILGNEFWTPEFWTRILGLIFVDSASLRGPEKFTLEKFTSQNSSFKLQPRNRGKNAHIALSAQLCDLRPFVGAPDLGLAEGGRPDLFWFPRFFRFVPIVFGNTPICSDLLPISDLSKFVFKTLPDIDQSSGEGPPRSPKFWWRCLLYAGGLQNVPNRWAYGPFSQEKSKRVVPPQEARGKISLTCLHNAPWWIQKRKRHIN